MPTAPSRRRDLILAMPSPVHPGEYVREEVLPFLAIPTEDAAVRLGVSHQYLLELLEEKVPLTVEAARGLGELAGNGPRLWMDLQEAFDTWLAHHGAGAELGRVRGPVGARAGPPQRHAPPQTSAYVGVYVAGLVNAYALEQQAVSILSRQVERLGNYPEMSDQIRLHIDESKAQAQRLEEILQSLGTSHSTLKDLVTSFPGNMAALAHAPMQDEVLKITYANFAFEHFEIAMYRSLLVMAELAGDQSGPTLLRQSLNEELQMADWIESHLTEVTRTYVQLEASVRSSAKA